MTLEDLVTVIGVFAVSITTLILIVWGISIFVNARTQRDARRVELHARLLDRIGSTREFAEFLATDDGHRFLEAITPASIKPQWRLVWSLQAGIVVFTIGTAIFLTGGDYGWTIMGIGLALIVATLVSWRVARAFGLVPSVRDMTSGAARPPA